jgi:DNA polymerase III epsilon subunit family exonuclease
MNSAPLFPPIFVAFDLETTGLSAEHDRIVEIGACRFDANGRDLGQFQSLVNPLRPVHPRAHAVHGISDDELATQPDATLVLPGFLEWLSEFPEATLLAHNAAFDAAFLGAELARIGHPPIPFDVVDTLPLSRRLVVDVPNHQLATLSRRFGLDESGAHRALADAIRVKGLWLAMTSGETPSPRIAYPIAVPSGDVPVPSGWDFLSTAMVSRRVVRIAYEGGTRGLAPREITPLRFNHMGGVAYVVAHCHVSATEKSFRLDRVKSYELV